MANKFEGVNFTTPTFRASYLNVFKPNEYRGKLTYGVEMLFHKEKTDLKPFKNAVMKVCVDTWGKDQAKWPKGLHLPFKDGDKMEDAGEAYRNHIAVRAKSNADNPPDIWGRHPGKSPNPTPKELYSGCYCQASLYIMPYDHMGNIGVTCLLKAIRLVEPGESLGGRRDTASDFEILDESEVESEGGEDSSEYDFGV